ncbi:hypothetical protein Bca52824_021071 [Brassica carinata]|uniref:MADS-box domain-containing protein n=1 Tax=Brassica carinata TaxID=52824 RepID=A0A8X8AZ46_BRACI|nr:hypothetical protein Bca52824_021071 [Brassica carinata]
MVKSGKKIAKVERKKRKKRVSRSAELRASAEKKEGSRSADFASLRDDLFREAAKLVAEDPSQRIAILVAPRTSGSNVAVQSFGYPSAEGVVRQFLKDTAPPPVPVPEDAEEEEEEEEEEEDWSKYYWWEDEKLLNSKDPVELMAAITEMEKLKKQLDVYTSETGQGSGTQEDDGSNSKP